MAAPSRRPQSRLAALSGLVGIALLAVGWFWDPTPPNDWSDRRLDAYLATHNTATPWLVVSVLQLLAVPFLWHFAGVLRDRLAAGGAADGLVRTAYASGRAFAISVLVFALLYASLPVGGVFGFRAPPAQIYLFVFGANFGLFILASTLSVLGMVVPVTVAAFGRKGIPLGLGIAGVPLGVAVLMNVVLFMSGVTLWIAITSIVLAISRPADPQPASSAPIARTQPSLPLGVPTM